MVITVTCPSCMSAFPVDPAKIPEGGVNARCTQCNEVFRVEKPAAEPPPMPEPPVAEAPVEAPVAEAPVAEPMEPTPVPPPLPTPVEAEAPAAPEPPVAEPAPPPIPEAPPVEAVAEPEPTPAPPSDPFAESAPFETGGAEAAVSEAPEAEAAEPVAPEVPPVPAEPAAPAAPEPPVAEPAPPPTPEAPASEPKPVQGFTFGKRDPSDKARRLARVLVSDMIMYNAERHQTALAGGTLEADFEEEIEKSWKEYVDQVGKEMAEGEGRAYWTAALNDILAKGEQVF